MFLINYKQKLAIVQIFILNLNSLENNIQGLTLVQGIGSHTGGRGYVWGMGGILETLYFSFSFYVNLKMV